MSNLSTFYDVLQTKTSLSKEVRNKFGKILSPDFNALDFWNLDENKVSQILASFLDPLGSHNQGDTFLNLFINQFELDFKFNETDKIRVECEHFTNNNRRVDIVITKNDNEKIIGIENKIYTWTCDQDNQVRDYIDYLENATNDNFYLLYLSPAAKQVSNSSICLEDYEKYTNRGKLKKITFEEDIIKLVHSFALNSESERVRYFLLEFESKLKEMFTGENYMDDTKMITEYILKSQDNLETSFEIANSLSTVKTQLREIFNAQLSDISEELGIKYEDSEFFPSNWKNHKISISLEENDIDCGIMKNSADQNKDTLPAVEQILRGAFKTTELWPWYKTLYTNIHIDNSFWLEINSGEAKQKVKEIVKAINDNFNTSEY